MNRAATIFALATPYAKSGIAVIRISGPQALQALHTLTGRAAWQPNQLHYTPLYGRGRTLDHALCVYFQAPQSFTGEDVAEIQCHGSLAVIRALLEFLGGMEHLRPAERGEFTRRALLHGKMDLLEAEGLADLIAAETSAQQEQAVRQMEGAMSAWYASLRNAIIRALAHLEAYIDFPDEEIPESVLQGLAGEVGEVGRILADSLAQHAKGERIREGIRVVILGAPNAGKSSLLNMLSQRDAAIVSEQAGTTRDVIEVHLELGGFPVILTDTAGLRETEDQIESEGIRRALARAGEADIKLLLVDASAPQQQSFITPDGGSIVVHTKIDIATHPQALPTIPQSAICISTRTGEGIPELLALLEARVRHLCSGEGAVITRARHRALLTQAQGHIQRYFETGILELQCEELRLAADSIGKITGIIPTDALLDLIFREFCIGK